MNRPTEAPHATPNPCGTEPEWSPTRETGPGAPCWCGCGESIRTTAKDAARYYSDTCRSRARRRRRQRREEELAATVATLTAPARRVHTEPSRTKRVEVYLEPEDLARLERLRELAGFRSRSAALRWLLREGIDFDECVCSALVRPDIPPV